MVAWRNTSEVYGLMAVLCHWVTAITVVGLFALGLWMTGLNYYSPWYQTGPDIHRSVGVLLAVLVSWRLIWRLVSPQPTPLADHRLWERRAARLTHALLYALLFSMFLSGYLITTADGRGLEVFDWFSIPSVVTGEQLGVTNLEDMAGDLHEFFAYSLMMLAALHALAAFKHHFKDKDATLIRMLGRKR